MTIVLGRPPKTEDELYHLTQALWGHTIPRHKVCPEHDAPFDAFACAYFAREPQILIHGSRGLSGKSRLMSILGLTMAAVKGGDVNIVGGSLNQSNNIHETMRDAWDYKNAPRYMLRDSSQTVVRLTNQAKIRPLTASQKTVRGPHPPFLLLDEIDEMDQAILDAAKGQPMPQKNWTGEILDAVTAMSSTWQYADKTFASEYRRFQEEGLPIFTWCYRDTANPIDGWLDPAFVEQKRREIPAEMWRVEYELGEPSIGNRAFDSEKVEETFSLPITTIKQKVAKDYEEYQFEEPRQDTDYVIAADWAKDVDFTVFSVYACSQMPAKVVYWVKMRRRPYPVMIEYFNKLMKAYNAAGIHDKTGLGGVVNDYLDRTAQGFIMSGMQRDNMLSEYVNAVENGKVRAPRIDTFYKSHLYCVAKGSLVRTVGGAVPIEELHVGELVWTRKGLRPVTRVVCNGRKPLVRLRTSDGHELRLTEDHAVATDRGWILAGELKPFDVVTVPTTDTTRVMPGSIAHQVLTGERVPVATELLSGNLHGTTLGVGQLLDGLQVEGIDAASDVTQVVDGQITWIDPIRKGVHHPVSQSAGSVTYPEPSVSRAVGVLGPQPAAVALLDPVEEVPHVNGYRTTHVIDVSPVEDGYVYDITVEGEHEFYANDILVKNCSVEDMYARGKEFHLPDEVCSMALGWHLIGTRAVAATPVVLPGMDKANWMDESVKHNRSSNREKNGWVGEVVNKTEVEDQEFSLMV